MINPKLLATLFIFLGSIYSGYGQVQNTYIKIYPYPPFVSLDYQEDGFTLATGYTDYAELLQMDTQGTVLWSKSFSSGLKDGATNAIRNLNQSFTIAGYMGLPDTGMQGLSSAWIAQLDAQGHLDWEKEWNLSGRSYVADIVELKDSSTMSAGTFCCDAYTHPSLTGKRGFMQRLNPSGDSISLVELSSGTSLDAMLALPSGDYMLIGSDDYHPLGQDATIYTTDSTGIEKSRHHYGHILASATDLIATGDSHVLVSGVYGDDTLCLGNFAAIKLDTNGALIWSKRYTSSSYQVCNAVCNAQDGGYYLAGSTQNPSSLPIRILVMKIDRYGELEWSHEYGENSRNSATDIVQMSNGDLIISGWSSSQGLLMRITSAGELLSSHEIPREGALIIYPNPTDNKLYIKHVNRKISRIQLLDLSGCVVQQWSGDVRELEVSKIVSGQYLLKLDMEDGDFQTQKITIQR